MEAKLLQALMQLQEIKSPKSSVGKLRRLEEGAMKRSWRKDRKNLNIYGGTKQDCVRCYAGDDNCVNLRIGKRVGIVDVEHLPQKMLACTRPSHLSRPFRSPPIPRSVHATPSFKHISVGFIA
jgi:hypothetical protein